MTMLGLGVSQAYAMAPDVSKAKDSAASIFAMLDRRPKIDSSSKQGKTFPIVWGEIEFDHVSFKYPTRPDIQIFKEPENSFWKGTYKKFQFTAYPSSALCLTY